MDAFAVYKDIQARTKGQFLIGVVGPVRTGKSTFIRRFLEVLALPAMEDNAKAEVRDQLPLSCAGTLITTVEPKFIPKEAVKLSLGEDIPIHLRLIDCVGFLVPDATGNMENEKERMVKTPWFEEAIPFHQAAEIGTRKVISEHSTLGLVVTTDGSFGEIPRNNFLDAEAKTVAELKKQGKAIIYISHRMEEIFDICDRVTVFRDGKYIDTTDVASVTRAQLVKMPFLKVFPVRLLFFIGMVPINKVEFL